VVEGYGQMSRFATMNNPYRSMKRMALAVGVLFNGFAASAQQAWFIFIQSDNQQPFYIQMGEKIYSSSAAGYLLLHSLKDSTYNLLIGFPQNQFPEQQFAVNINKKDQGYQLKKASARQWELYNWQTEQALKPVAGKKSSSPLYGERKVNDHFADLMAAVVNDTAVLYTSVVKKEPDSNNNTQTKPDSVKAIAVNTKEKAAPVLEDSGRIIQPLPERKAVVAASDSNVAAKTAKRVTDSANQIIAAAKPIDTSKQVVKTVIADTLQEKVAAIKKPADPVKRNEPVEPGIVKLKERQENDSLTLTFLDNHAAGADTVQVIIALAKERVQPQPSEPVKPEPVKKDSIVTATDTPVIKKTDTVISKKDTALAVMPKLPEKKPDTTTIAVTTELATEPAKKALAMVNSDCRNFATDNDIDKLRVRMLLESTAGDRMVAAQKLYKTHCLSAKQIKALSELFMTDETKYRFLELSYPHVSDTDNFKKLYDLLTDETLKAKFRTLVRM
jgi:hypothetical protein